MIKNESKTLYEHQELKIDEREREEVEKLNQLQEIFKITSKGIKAKHFVGIIQLGNKTIEVLPKILNKKENSQVRKNLLYMLSYTKKLKIKETDISNLSKTTTLFESIIYLFAKNLLDHLKKDFIRNYETQEENAPFLKGKLLMSKHLRYNLFNKSKFYSQYDEFTENNLLNQTFKATISRLIRLTKNSSNFKLLSECDLILTDVEKRSITIRDTQKVKFNRLNSQYEDIFNLAKLLLFGNSIELNSKNIKTYSLMFDMNKLFEEFIFNFIKKEIKSNYIIRSELPQKTLFIEPPQFSLKPDITFYEGKECELILDTKYKEITDVKSEKYGISTQDIYQMFTYSKIYKCDKIILLYPKYNKEIKDIELTNNEIGLTIIPRTVDLHIDLLKEKNKLKEKLEEILPKNVIIEKND